MLNLLKAAKANGKRAGFQGMSYQSCPFPRKNILRRHAWLTGWDEGMKERLAIWLKK